MGERIRPGPCGPARGCRGARDRHPPCPVPFLRTRRLRSTPLLEGTVKEIPRREGIHALWTQGLDEVSGSGLVQRNDLVAREKLHCFAANVHRFDGAVMVAFIRTRDGPMAGDVRDVQHEGGVLRNFCHLDLIGLQPLDHMSPGLGNHIGRRHLGGTAGRVGVQVRDVLGPYAVAVIAEPALPGQGAPFVAGCIAREFQGIRGGGVE